MHANSHYTTESHTNSHHLTLIIAPQGRTPLDLVTRELGRYCQQPHAVAASAARAGSGPDAPCKHAAQVFSWGSGANYQLGTGVGRLDALLAWTCCLHGE